MDLNCKAQCFAGGNLNGLTQSLNYSSVVSKYVVCIMLTISSVNDLYVSFYMGNYCLSAEVDGKV